MKTPLLSLSLLSLVSAVFIVICSWLVNNKAAPSSSNCAPCTNIDNLLRCLKSSILKPDIIYTPEDPSYWFILGSSAPNLRAESESHVQPIAIVTPSLPGNIQATISCCKKNCVLLRVRSGGHDSEGLSYTSPISFVPFYAILDLRNQSKVTVDVDEQTAWVEAGATLGELYYEVANRTKTLAAVGGDCPTVGCGGHVSGGGISTISRKFGIAADQVIDAEIIDANGQILNGSTMGDELFWAIRGGGGGSFGVITAFQVKLQTVPENVTVFNVTRRSLDSKTAELVYQWQSIAPKVDPNLTLWVEISSRKIATSASQSTESRRRTVVASFGAMYLGGKDALLQIMEDKFPQLGVTREDCTEMSWIQTVLFLQKYDPFQTPLEVLLNRTPKKEYFKWKLDYVKSPIPESGLQGIWDRLNAEGEHVVKLDFHPYGGIMANISEYALPYPHRAGILYHILCEVTWEGDGTDTQKHLDWVRELHRYLTPYVSSSPREAFLDIRDLDLGTNNMTGNTSYLQASKWGYKYFKYDNFMRLVRVKNRVDPANFFRNEQSIPIELPPIGIDRKASQ